jgi:hypothetical protein
MKPLFLCLLLLPLCICAWGQKAQRQLEVVPYLRYDRYPEFIFANNTTNWYTLKIKGTSWGVNTALKHPLTKNLRLKAGLGYYKYSFNDLESQLSIPNLGKGDRRSVSYASDIYILFYTPKYWYNCLTGSLGVERPFFLKRGFEVVGGATLSSYFTYNQRYYWDYEYPAHRGNKYRRSNSRFFGFSALVHAGVLKQVGKVSVGPTVSVPVYDIWKQDDTFIGDGRGESNADSRSKWIRGISGGISINYSLPTK